MRPTRKRKSSFVASDNEDVEPRQLRQSKKVNYAVDSSDHEQLTRPSRVLPTNRVKKADRKETKDDDDDDKEPKLLKKLPAEIRARIWAMVLGGNNIHIWSEKRNLKNRPQVISTDEGIYYTSEELREKEAGRKYRYPKRVIAMVRLEDSDDENSDDDKLEDKRSLQSSQLRLQRSICNRTSTDQEHINQNRAEDARVRSRGHKSWHRRHRRCRHAHRRFLLASDLLPKLDLSLLSVCRQIHGEAALLPYQENTFAFTHFTDLALFIATLIPSQLHAIQHVNMAYAYGQSDNTLPSIESKIKTSFQTLKSLTIQLDSCEDWSFHWERVSIFADLMQFKKLPIENVTVQATLCDRYLLKEEFFTLQEFEGWAGDVEEMLARDWVVKDKKVLGELRTEARRKFGFSEKWT